MTHKMKKKAEAASDRENAREDISKKYGALPSKVCKLGAPYASCVFAQVNLSAAKRELRCLHGTPYLSLKCAQALRLLLSRLSKGL